MGKILAELQDHPSLLYTQELKMYVNLLSPLILLLFLMSEFIMINGWQCYVITLTLCLIMP